MVREEFTIFLSLHLNFVLNAVVQQSFVLYLQGMLLFCFSPLALVL